MKTEKTNLLFIHSSTDWFGSDKCLYEILRLLDQSQFHPLVVLPNSGPLTDKIQELGITVTHPPYMSIIHKYRNPVLMVQYFIKLGIEVIWLMNFMRKNKIALVHVNTTSTLGGLIAAKIYGIPSVSHVREIRTAFGWIGRLLATTVNFFATHILAISNGVSDYMKSGWLSPRSLQVLHDGINLDSCFSGDSNRIREQLNIPANKKVVGAVGRMTFWKGMHVFIDAATELAENHPEGLFLIVGGPDTEQSQEYFDSLQDKVRERGLGDHIRFLGIRKDIPEIMSAFDIFVLPSVFPEPFGLVTIEAMLAGKPVIVTRHGGSLDIVREDIDGFLVPPGEPARLAEKIDVLLNDPKRCQEMGSNGRKRIRENFDLNKHAQEVMDVYRRVLSGISQ